MKRVLLTGMSGTGKSSVVRALIAAGCEENQVRFHSQFDHIILLSAPAAVLLERLANRASSSYGKAPAERSRVLADLDAIEPLLRCAADDEVETTVPLSEVVANVLRIIDESPTRPAAV